MDAGYNPSTGEWNASLSGDYLWSNVNFGEAVSDVMTPLSWAVLRLVLADWVFLPGYETTGNIGGRPYLNISVPATVLRAMGRSREDLLKTLESMLYMRLPETMEIPLIPVSRWSVLSALPKLIRMQARQWQGVRELAAFVAGNPAWFAKVRQQIQNTVTKAGLLALWHEEIRPHVTKNVWAVLGSASHSSDYTMRLRRDLAEMLGPDDAARLISSLSDGADMLASLGPVAGLAQVARGKLERQAYLERYGHRGPHEFELSVPRPAEDPTWLDQQLARLHEAPVDVEALLAKQRAEFDEAWARLESRHPRKAKRMQRRIVEAARRTRMREAARSEYVRDRWAVRLFALRASELTDLGDDVFFLTMDDLLHVLSGDENSVGSIPARKETYDRYKTLPAYPSIIRGPFDPFQWALDPQRRTDIFDATVPRDALATSSGPATIVGSPGSAGRVEGLVRRLDRPEDGAQLCPGEILVAAQTDIAWTPLFPRAGAVITDVGAPLSHAAIVARELGIPAVVGCGDATMRLKTGDQVVVDGSRGIVEILTERTATA
jgi:phosphohistidine swiveling domain-containing protein